MIFKNIKMWYISKFKIMSLTEALDYDLTFVTNFFGDEINVMNCRSLFADKNGKYFKVKELYYKHEDIGSEKKANSL